MSGSPRPGDSIELTIASLGYGGEGVGKYEGMAFFVSGGLPGDTLLVSVDKVKKRYGRGRLERIISPSPHRVEPPCGMFARGCGGCQWLHLDYPAQLEYKAEILKQVLRRIGGVEAGIEPVVPAPRLDRCRNKFSLGIGADGSPGLSRSGSHEVLILDDCPMETDVNNELYTLLKGLTIPSGISRIDIRSNPEGGVALCLHGRGEDRRHGEIVDALGARCENLVGAGVISPTGYTHLMGSPYVSINLDGVSYRLPHGSFFQTNYEQASVLRRLLESHVEDGSSVLDLYCGVGFFTLPLSMRCDRVHGIESDPRAVDAARVVAASSEAADVTFSQGDVSDRLGGFKAGEFSVVIVDPPRAGCHPAALDGVRRLRPDRIIYVSCAPDTLARDLAVLTAGGYTVSCVQPVDMFPQTYHLETVVLLERS